MSRLTRLIGVLALVAAGSVSAAPASANAFEIGYCPVTELSGAVAYSSRVTTAPAPNSFVMDVICEATVFVGHNVGSYWLTLTGTSDIDMCAATVDHRPSGSGTLIGSGPEGAIDGTFRFVMAGGHYILYGDYTSGAKPHMFWLAVQHVNPSPAPCDYDHAELVGQAMFEDTSPPDISPPPQGAFTVQGGATISPGITPLPAPSSWTFAGTMTGEFDGEPGSCNASFTGAGLGSLGSETGSGAGRCRGTTAANTVIDFTCTFTYTRALAVVTVSPATSTCTGTQPGDLTAELTLTPTSFMPITSAAVQGWAAIA